MDNLRGILVRDCQEYDTIYGIIVVKNLDMVREVEKEIDNLKKEMANYYTVEELISSLWERLESIGYDIDDMEYIDLLYDVEV